MIEVNKPLTEIDTDALIDMRYWCDKLIGEERDVDGGIARLRKEVEGVLACRY